MPKTRQQKQDSVTKLQEKLAKAKSVVFADYKGLTMKQLSDLRNQLRDQKAEFTITKNTLLDLAMKEIASSPSTVMVQGPRNDVIARDVPTGTSRGNLIFEGPTAVLLSYDDEISPIKLLVKTLKDAGLGKVKMGFLGDEILDEVTILKLATLPGQDGLRGQIVGVLAAPLQGLVGVLQGNLRNLVYALSELQKMKGGDVQASS